MPAESTGQKTTAVTTINGNVPVSASSGRFSATLVTGSATSALITIYDNATTNSGTIIGYIASGSVVSAFQAYDIPVANGIVVNSATANQTFTIVYSVS